MSTTRRLFALLACSLVAGCGKKGSGSDGSVQAGEELAAAMVASEELAAAMVASEELILELTPRLRAFGDDLFAASCTFRGLSDDPGERAAYQNLQVIEQAWSTPLKETTSAPPRIADLLLPLGDSIPTLEALRFAIVTGRFIDGARDRFQTEVSLSAAGEETSVTSSHSVVWRKTSNPPHWQITEWQERRLTALYTPSPLFEEVLDDAIPDSRALAAARTSLHHKILVEGYFGGNPPKLPKGYSDSRFYPDSVNIHPAVSAADVDGDGLDDLYVCVRWGKNLLLRNRGDGTFEECAARYGLDVDGRNTVALFADFDNDGDADLLLGRSLERSLFLVNDAGRFQPHPNPVSGGELPWLVTSASAADFNNDGLLDVYLCTYSPLDINSRINSGAAANGNPEWAQQFLSPEHAAEVGRRTATAHSYLGQVGPPNILLVNRGTSFELAPAFETLVGFRNSFHAAWNDFDRDGDQDLYVANDFAPDLFYRNNGDAGFTDITESAGIDTMGFAMGSAWGDYDGDGFDDLYVSNMYSKAGRRITAQVPGLDDRFTAVSGGNFLYRNRGDRTLARMSGADAKPVPVHLAGWSWGGQFSDFDNDGNLDLYVSSGFYTPPAGQDIGVDL